MLRYQYRAKLMAGVVAVGLGGVLFSLVLGVLCVLAWVAFLSGSLDWSVTKLLGFSFGAVLPWTALFSGCTHCTDTVAQEDGMRIKTCFFFRFFVPWEDVIDLQSGRTYSLRCQRAVAKSLVTIKRGLTPLHRGLPTTGSIDPRVHNATPCPGFGRAWEAGCSFVRTNLNKGWQWPRGFIITSQAQGYADLVQAIEETVKAKSTWR